MENCDSVVSVSVSYKVHQRTDEGPSEHFFLLTVKKKEKKNLKHVANFQTETDVEDKRSGRKGGEADDTVHGRESRW